jgi:hypothetical protein
VCQGTPDDLPGRISLVCAALPGTISGGRFFFFERFAIWSGERKRDGADYGLKMIFRQEEHEVQEVLRRAGAADGIRSG